MSTGFRLRAALFLGVVAMAASCGPPPTPPPGATFGPLSLGSGDVFGNDTTTGASISNDGNWVAFSSAADNLVPGDDNNYVDTFLRDRVTGSVQRVAERTIFTPRISGNGRYVSYVINGGPAGMYDRITGTTVTWTAMNTGSTPVVTDDGTEAVYGRGGSFGIFSTACRVRDLVTGAEADCPHGGPGFGTVALDAVSRNGRFVLYYWLDQNGGNTSARRLWDRQTDTFTPAPPTLMVFGTSVVVSDDGVHLASTEFAPDVSPSPRLFNLQNGSISALPGPAPDGNTIPIDVSANGNVVALYSEATNLSPDDTNGGPDIYLWNVSEATVTLASRRLDTGAALPTGATQCGSGSGQMLASGAGVCVRTNDPLLPEDTNSVTDAWLVPG